MAFPMRDGAVAKGKKKEKKKPTAIHSGIMDHRELHRICREYFSLLFVTAREEKRDGGHQEQRKHVSSIERLDSATIIKRKNPLEDTHFMLFYLIITFLILDLFNFINFITDI